MTTKHANKIWHCIISENLKELNTKILLDVRHFIDHRNKSGKPIKCNYGDPVDRIIDVDILMWHHDDVTRTLQIEEEKHGKSNTSNITIKHQPILVATFDEENILVYLVLEKQYDKESKMHNVQYRLVYTIGGLHSDYNNVVNGQCVRTHTIYTQHESEKIDDTITVFLQKPLDINKYRVYKDPVMRLSEDDKWKYPSREKILKENVNEHGDIIRFTCGHEIDIFQRVLSRKGEVFKQRVKQILLDPTHYLSPYQLLINRGVDISKLDNNDFITFADKTIEALFNFELKSNGKLHMQISENKDRYILENEYVRSKWTIQTYNRYSFELKLKNEYIEYDYYLAVYWNEDEMDFDLTIVAYKNL